MTELLLRFSYPKVPGDSPWSIVDLTGPSSYVQITPGDPGPPVTPPSGGQEIFPSDFGLQAFDIILSMASSDGKFAVELIPILLGDDTFDKMLVMWIDLASMQQASSGQDLSQSSEEACCMLARSIHIKIGRAHV